MKKILIHAILLTSVTLLVGYGSCDENTAARSNLKSGGEMNFDEPIFTKTLGRLSVKEKGNKEKTCILKGDHRAIVNNLAEITKQLNAAKTQPIAEAVHFRAEVPSIEIYGHLYVPDDQGNLVKEDVLLLEDYSKLRTRDGDDAKHLVDLVNKTCSQQ